METSNAEWWLKNNALFHIFYEYTNYWNVNSLSSIMLQADFEIIATKKLFNEQHIGIVGKKCKSVLYLCKQFAKDIEKIKDSIIAFLQRKYENKISIALWGAGGRGVTFVNFFDSDKKYISYLVDINPMKRNTFVAKTAHKIISPKDILNQDNLENTEFILLNDNYLEEVKRTLICLGINSSVYSFDLFAASGKDFVESGKRLTTHPS